jgi:hypothetical protein
MEPDAGSEVRHGDDHGRALVSIAISLKRIADAIEGVPYDPTPGADNSKHGMPLTDGIMHAIERGLLAASQRG